MPSDTLRFLFASDLDPDRPIELSAAVPGKHNRVLESATRRAISRLGTVCCERDVEFLLIAGHGGDRCGTGASGLHSLQTLADQCAAINIPVIVLASDTAESVAWQRVRDHLVVLDADSPGCTLDRADRPPITIGRLDDHDPVESTGPRLGWTPLGQPPDRIDPTIARQLDFLAIAGTSAAQTTRSGRLVTHGPGPIVPFETSAVGRGTASLVTIDNVGPATITPIVISDFARVSHEVHLAPGDSQELAGGSLPGDMRKILDNLPELPATDAGGLMLCQWDLVYAASAPPPPIADCLSLLDAASPPHWTHLIHTHPGPITPDAIGPEDTFAFDLARRLREANVAEMDGLLSAVPARSVPDHQDAPGYDWTPGISGQDILSTARDLACRLLSDSDRRVA